MKASLFLVSDAQAHQFTADCERLLVTTTSGCPSLQCQVTGANFFIDAMFSDARQTRAVTQCRDESAARLPAGRPDGRALVGVVPSDRRNPPSQSAVGPAATQQSVTCARSFTTSRRPGRALITGRLTPFHVHVSPPLPSPAPPTPLTFP